MVDYATTSYGTSACSKFRLGEFLDGYILYEDFYIVTDIAYIFLLSFKSNVFLFKNSFHLI